MDGFKPTYSRKTPVHGTIHSDVGFYIGDICYVMKREDYHVWTEDYGCSDGKIPIRDGYEVLIGSTAFGDGTYRGSDGFSYSVDAGIIGAVPFELLDVPVDEAKEYGTFHEGTVCDFDSYEGIFKFTIGDEEIIIDTKGYEDDYEDWDNEYDEEDDE